MVKVQVPVRFVASVAVQVTVVVPTGKLDPEAGEQTTVAPGQLSFAVGVGYVTIPAGTPEIFAGQVTVGACVSLTVTVKLQVVAPPLEHVTVVVPLGKVEPDAGVQVTAHPGVVGGV